jgi:peroxiredoxin
VIGVRFGQAAPGFSLPSTGGGEVALADFKGTSDVVLVFYCYDWGSI